MRKKYWKKKTREEYRQQQNIVKWNKVNILRYNDPEIYWTSESIAFSAELDRNWLLSACEKKRKTKNIFAGEWSFDNMKWS